MSIVPGDVAANVPVMDHNFESSRHMKSSATTLIKRISIARQDAFESCVVFQQMKFTWKKKDVMSSVFSSLEMQPLPSTYAACIVVPTAEYRASEETHFFPAVGLRLINQICVLFTIGHRYHSRLHRLPKKSRTRKQGGMPTRGDVTLELGHLASAMLEVRGAQFDVRWDCKLTYRT